MNAPPFRPSSASRAGPVRLDQALVDFLGLDAVEPLALSELQDGGCDRRGGHSHQRCKGADFFGSKQGRKDLNQSVEEAQSK